jgi:transcriptional regulator with XRE-family HTH domain
VSTPQPAGIRSAPLVRLPMRYAEHRRAAFGVTVRRYRLAVGLTVDVLADLVGLDVGYLSAVEDDQLMPNVDVLFALGDALGTDAAELLHGTRVEAERLVAEEWLQLRPHPAAAMSVPSELGQRGAGSALVELGSGAGAGRKSSGGRGMAAAPLPLVGRVGRRAAEPELPPRPG